MLDGITDLMDMSLSLLWELVMDQGGLACCSLWGRKELDMTEWLNWTCCAKACKFDSGPISFVFIYTALGNWPKKTLIRFMSENVFPMLSSGIFVVSCLMTSLCRVFTSLSHFEFIFVCGEKGVLWLHRFTYSSLTFPTPLAKETFFHHIFLPPLSRINWLYVSEYIFRLSILFHWFICLFLYWYHIILSIVAL